ncbi:MAG: tRNA (N6-isopentenyl adenosine(37)-C2)-methylthiotransferase MiaB [Clostridiales bacterium]|jgi:tRNA-2-methylthio-N6-dimethylallyladenosine synthase|nr:tRNA (N6-isopentenyl adenosine(37)-C2)-methylthiotransferase MiaB [Clostridiales bacterium]MCI2161615.1 tRNA (N6-isopentenyl adenosine(37)-C2)-methylthiotransferase MiaB [Oscillospiraceae bacterium]MCI1960347.1 tRNA (N6-isopentenyl adenosine(37)-C2)-methylthiotransferase MiaB [Clostridiales bacterium]MCI2020834.1 tRNA (N6-isopentenyl adenosine(37)-C2)-methylthiotransferase MiaB [Clostridiales bacterium]MCI2025217.1 tRNA (N6-isopentenyl adenosine(37)-C2)-methylthiotransferase MiaB [Clostridia
MAQQFSLQYQNLWIQQLKEIMRARTRKEMPLAMVHTYGCQQNVADSEKIEGMLQEMGFGFTKDPKEADLILFNTCAVREHAEDRVFGNVGALKNIKRLNPQLIIALCGCMMEQEHVAKRIRESFPYVDLVFGTHVIHRFPELLFHCLTDHHRIFSRGDDSEDREIMEGLPIRRDGKVKAWLTIMYGCDNFCSYCVVPYVRGRERSRTPEAVIKEFQELVQSGYKDITLLGQNVNSYGKNPDCGLNFAGLLKKLDEIPGDYRIRFMTSHPKDCTHELLDVMANGTHIAHHLHLPFQSGNDRVLKEMNRHYDRAQYLELIHYAKKVMPDLSLTSDVIVGFPGETYPEFLDTVSLIEEVGFTSLFTFIYSPRVGTRAASLPDPISAEEKSKWFQELCKKQEEIAAVHSAKKVGAVERVLVEEEEKKPGMLSGRTGGNIIVDFPGSRELCGTFQNVRVTKARNWILEGEII